MRLLTVVAVITGCEEESLIAVDEKKTLNTKSSGA